MSKKQNLLRLSITLLIIMALAVGILGVTLLGNTNVKGGSAIVDGNSTFNENWNVAGYGDMPDVSNFVQVRGAHVTAAENLINDYGKNSKYDYFMKDAANPIVAGRKERHIKTAAELVYVLREAPAPANYDKEANRITYILDDDFIIADSTFFIDRRLHTNFGINLDGNGHTVVSNYNTGFDDFDKKEEVYQNFGGFLSYIEGYSTVSNLNYYLAPTAVIIAIQNSGPGAGMRCSVGGFAGTVRGKVMNCNFNIYGAIYSFRLWEGGLSETMLPMAGGVFGAIEGKVENNVFNVTGASISASSKGRDTIGYASKCHRLIGGVAGLMKFGGGSQKFSNNVINVAPSTAIGGDIFGLNSTQKETGYNESGIVFGRVDGGNIDASKNNYFANYNNYYDYGYNSQYAGQNGLSLYTVPKVIGAANSADLRLSKLAAEVQLYGASFFGDDVRFKVDMNSAPSTDPATNGYKQVKIHLNKNSYTDASASPTDMSDWFGSTEFTNGGRSEEISVAMTAINNENGLHFYKGMNDASYTLKDTYTWNRLVSLSGTAYFHGNPMTQTHMSDGSGYKQSDIAVVNPFFRMSTDTAAKALTNVVGNVVLDTSAYTDHTLRLDGKAAPAFELHSMINGYEINNRENNVIDFTNMTRRGGAIRRMTKFPQDGSIVLNGKDVPAGTPMAEAGFKNLTIVNGVEGNAAVVDATGYTYTFGGALIDNVADGVKFDNLIINNNSIYRKDSTNNGNIAEPHSTMGNLYLGGMFGKFSGIITNSDIDNTANVEINKMFRRHDSSRIFAGGFAAVANGLNISNSVIDNKIGRIAVGNTGAEYTIGGFVGRSFNAVKIDNSIIKTNVQSIAGEVESGKSAELAGFISTVSINNPVKEGQNNEIGTQISNTIIDTNLSDIYNDTKSFKDRSYTFCSTNDGVKFENSLINLNESYGLHDVAFVSIRNTGNESLTVNNSWIYNNANINDHKWHNMGAIGGQAGNFNYAYTLGNTTSGSRGKLIFKDIDKLTSRHLQASGTGSNNVNNPTTYDFANACAKPEFIAARSGAIYNTNKTKWYNDPSKPMRNFGSAGVVESGIGFFSGMTLGGTPNFVTEADGSYTLRALPINKEVTVTENGEPVTKQVFDHYQYSFRSNEAVNGKRLFMLYGTKDITDAAEWNQVAKNANDGLSRDWIDHVIKNDISGNLIGMGKEPTLIKDEQGTVTKTIDCGINGDVLGEKFTDTITGEERYPVIRFKLADTNKRNSGLFAYVGAKSNIGKFDIEGNIAANWSGIPRTNSRLKDDTGASDIHGGILAGWNKGNISNVNITVKGNIIKSFYHDNDVMLGLIAGRNDGTIDRVAVDVPETTEFRFGLDQAAKPKVDPGNKDETVEYFNNLNVYTGGAVGFNNGTISNTIVNLNNLKFVPIAPGSHPVKPNLKVAGGIGYNAGSDISGLHVSARLDNFDRAKKDGFNPVVASYVNNGQTNGLNGFVLGYNVGASNIAGSFVEQGIPSYSEFNGNKHFDDNYVKKVTLTGDAKKDANINVLFDLKINKFENGSVNTNKIVNVTLQDDKTFAIAYIKGHGKSGKNNFQSSFKYNVDNIMSMNDDAFRLSFFVVANDITDAASWNTFADSVNTGATFEGNTFKVSKFTASNLTTVAKSLNSSFKGILEGNGNTITLNGYNSSDTAELKALIGHLGTTGAVRDLNIVVTGAYNNSGAKKDAALLVARNNGAIENVNIKFNDESVDRTITATNAGIIVGKNAGSVINVDVDLNNYLGGRVVVDGSNNAGGLIGLNSGSLVNSTLASTDLQVNGTNAGLIVGQNVINGIVKTVVSTINMNTTYSANTRYFIGKVDTSDANIMENIDNVWTLVTIPEYNLDNISNYSEDVNKHYFNVIYKYDLDSSNVNATSLTAEIVKNSIKFSASKNEKDHPFYGYVDINTDENNTNKVVGIDNIMILTDGQHGHEYAAVYAKRYIKDINDLNNIRKYSGNDKVINGLVFELTSNIILNSVTYKDKSGKTNDKLKMIDWEPIKYLNHKIDGAGKYWIKTSDDTSTIVDANTIFRGFVENVTKTGGFTNLNIKMAVTMGSNLVLGEKIKENVPTNALLVTGENNGVIDKVNVELYGSVQAGNAEKLGDVGIIAAKNGANGVINMSNVSLMYATIYNDPGADTGQGNSKKTDTALNASNNAGVIVGINDGKIIGCQTTFGNNTILQGKYLGVIAGTNNGLIMGSNTIEDNGKYSVNMAGKVRGMNIGGVAGANNGTIANMTVNANRWYARAAMGQDMNFGGVTANNNGFVSGVVININEDSSIAGFANAAGVAYDNAGYIANTTVNINRPLVAVNGVAGFVVTSDNGDMGAIVDSVVNINAELKATDKEKSKAAGVVLNGYTILNNVFVKVNSKLNAVESYILGETIHNIGTVNRKTIDKNGVVKPTEEALSNAGVIIYGKASPNKDANEYGLFKTNDGAVSFDNSWFIKNNTYSIPLTDDAGNAFGFNEFKVLSNDAIEFSRVDKVVTASVSCTAGYRLDSFADGSYTNIKKDALKYSVDIDLAASNVKNMQYLVTKDNFVIDNITSYKNVANAIDSADLYYDIPIILNQDIVLDGAGIIPLGGSRYGFTSRFYGNNHTIDVLTNINGTNSGVFSVIDRYASVENLLVNIGGEVDGSAVKVIIGSTSSNSTGGIAGTIKGTVKNVGVRFYNSSDEDILPELQSNGKSGAFAGVIENTANMTNSWAFFQNGRYKAPNMSAGNGFNTVNLGGTSNVIVKINALDNSFEVVTSETVWTNSDGGVVDVPFDEPTTTYKMDASSNGVILNVRLINTDINNAADLIELSKNQTGFTISTSEVFELKQNIEITVDDIKTASWTTFLPIGNNNRPFRSKFNGNHFTITFNGDVVMGAAADQPAGLFGRVAETASIYNLKVVFKPGKTVEGDAINTKFEGNLYAGGLAGINESNDIKNVIVKYDCTPEVKEGVSFGGIFGSNSAQMLGGVYLIKNYKNKIRPVGMSADLNNTNVVDVYSDKNDTFDLVFDVNKNNSFTISATPDPSIVDSDYKFYGMIDVNSDSNKIENGTILVPSPQNMQYAAVFVKTKINTFADLVSLVSALDRGFNIKNLEYTLGQDIYVDGFIGNSTMHDKDVAFQSIFNGDGHKIVIGNSKFYGTYAGLFGNVGRYGVIKNLTLDVYDTQIGGTPTAADIELVKNLRGVTLDYSTEVAGILVGNNEGTIENVVVNNLGNIVKDGKGVNVYGNKTDMFVGVNNTEATISDVWYVQANSTKSIDINNAVSVIEYVSVINEKSEIRNEKVLTGIKADGVYTVNIVKAGESYTQSITKYDGSEEQGFLYKMSDMNKVVPFASYDENRKPNRFVFTEFDLVVDNAAKYNSFVTFANNAKRTPLADVVISLNGLNLPSGNYATVGTDDKPFDGIIDGHGTALTTTDNSKFVGTKYAGIFGYIAPIGVIKNLSIVMDGIIEASPKKTLIEGTNKHSYSDIYRGVIAYNAGTIENVVVRINDTATRVETFNLDKDDKYTGRIYDGAVVGSTDKKLNNVWYIKDTSIKMDASTTPAKVSGINVFTVVGGDIDLLNASVDVQSNSVVFTKTAGKFYRDFNGERKANLDNSISFTVAKEQIYELVNVAISEDNKVVLDDASWQVLAVDTHGGYSFDGITFVIEKPINITTSSEYALGEFGGVISAAPQFAGDYHIILSNKDIDNMVDFAIFDTLTDSAEINNINIKVQNEISVEVPGKEGADPTVEVKTLPVNLKYSNTKDRPLGVIANTNNGTFNGGQLFVNANISNNDVIEGKTGNVAAFIGINNGVVNGYNISMQGKALVNDAFGVIAIENNDIIKNVVVTLDRLAVEGDTGYYAFGVAKNNAGGTITNIDMTIGNATYIKASASSKSVVAMVTAKNAGKISKVDILVNGNVDPNNKFVLYGKMASYFVVENAGGDISNAVVKAINNESIKGGKFVYATSVNNHYDFSNGTGRDLWIIVDSRDTTYDRTVDTSVATIIKVVGMCQDIKYSDKAFTPIKDATVEGLVFNGWFRDNTKLPNTGTSDIYNLDRTPSNQGLRLEAIFVNTIISNETEWNLFADLINSGKNVEDIKFDLKPEGGTLVLGAEGKITPVGTLAHPFSGTFDGQNNSIEIAGNIVADYAGLFGCIKNAKIANIKNITLDENMSIKGSENAGVLAASSIDSIIGMGTFTKAAVGYNLEEAAKIGAENTVGNIVVNGTVTATKMAGGIVANMVATDGNKNSLRFMIVINNGLITATDMGSLAGGFVGYNKNSLIEAATLKNNSNINSKGFAGGIVAKNESKSAIKYINVESFEKNAIIYGTSGAGAIAGSNISDISTAFVKYHSDNSLASDTKAIANFQTNDIMIDQAWVVTTDSQILNRSIDDLNKIVDENGKRSSLRVIRTDADRLGNIERAVGTPGNPNDVIFTTLMVENAFNYWKFTNGKSLYKADGSAFNVDFINVNGIKKVDNLSFDITLEQRTTIENIDHIRGLNVFAGLADEDYNAAISDTTVFTLANDLNVENDAVALYMKGGYTIDGAKHIILMNSGMKFSGGKLVNVIIASRENVGKINLVNNFSATILKDVTLVDGMVYRLGVDGDFKMPAKTNDAYQFLPEDKNGGVNALNNGNIEIAEVVAESTPDNAAKSTNVKVVTRDTVYNDATSIVVGNVPLVVNGDSIDVVAYNAGEYGDYADSVKIDNKSYYFLHQLNDTNMTKALGEMDYILKKGYDFSGQTINIMNDLTMPANTTIGSKTEGVGFNGTLDGHNSKMTFADGYSALFANIGKDGKIENFIVNVKYNGKPVFQGGQSNGTMSNIVIVNSGTTGYTQATITYDNVLVVQDVAGINYDRLYELKTTADKINVSNYDDIITIRMNALPEGKIFAGFRDTNKNIITAFANGITLTDLSTAKVDNINPHHIVPSELANVITDEASWNAIAEVIASVNTEADKISIGNDLELTIGSYKSMMSNGRRSADIIGNNKKITINAPTGAVESVPVFNGYIGNISNLVIVAYGSGLKANEVTTNNGSTVYNKVMVITKKAMTRAADAGSTTGGKVINIIIADGVTFTPDNVDVATSTLTLPTHATDKNQFWHITDEQGRAVFQDRADYSKLVFTGVALSNEYNVELANSISSSAHIISALKCPNALTLEMTDNIVIRDNLDIKKADLTITANGKMITVDKNTTLTLTNGILNNAVVAGNGTFNVVDTASMTNVFIISTSKFNATSEGTKGTLTNVWRNAATDDKTNANLYSIDIKNTALNANGEPLFAIAFASDVFTITLNDAVDANGNPIYYLGNRAALEAAPTIELKAHAKPEPIVVATIDYISSVLDSTDVIKSYNDLLGKMDNTNLHGKTFFIDTNMVIEDGAVFKVNDKPFVLNARGNEIIIKGIIQDNTNGLLPGFLNVTLEESVLRLHGNANRIFQGTIGDKTVAIVYDSLVNKFVPSETTFKVEGNYHIVRILKEGIADNDYNYSNKNIGITTLAGSDFVAKMTYNKRVKNVDEKGNVTYENKVVREESVKSLNYYDLISDFYPTYSAKDPTSKRETNISFYVPVNVSIAGNNNWNDLEKLLTPTGERTFPQYVLYDSSKLDNTLALNTSDNFILAGYSINDKVQTVTGTSIPFAITNAGKAIKIVLDIKKVDPQNITTEYGMSVDGKDTYIGAGVDYNEATYIKSIGTKVLPEGYVLDAASIVDYTLDPSNIEISVPVERPMSDAGKYMRRIDVKKGDAVVGHIHYIHTIDKYNLDNRMLKVADRVYAGDNKSAAFVEDTFFNSLPADIKNIFKGTDTAHKFALAYDTADAGKNKDAKIVAEDAVIDYINGLEGSNFSIKKFTKFKGVINKLNVDITFDPVEVNKDITITVTGADGKEKQVTYKGVDISNIVFNYRENGDTVFGDIGIEYLNKMVTNGVTITASDISKKNANLPYFYVSRTGSMLNVGTHRIEHNIANTNNCTFTIDMKDSKVNVTPAEYDITLAYNGTHMNYMDKVGSMSKYFTATVNDANAKPEDAKATASLNFVWDAGIVASVGGTWRFVALPTTEGTVDWDKDKNAIHIYFGGKEIPTYNYNQAATVVNIDKANKSYTIGNMNLNNGLGLVNKETVFSGTTPDIKAGINNNLYSGLDFKYETYVVEEVNGKLQVVDLDKVFEVGEYQIAIIIKNKDGEAVTDYINYTKLGDKKTVELADGKTYTCFIDTFNINKRSNLGMRLVNKDITYGGAEIADNDTCYFRFNYQSLNDMFIGANPKLKIYLSFKDAEGKVKEYAQTERGTIPAGEYVVTFDPTSPSNAALMKNVDVKVVGVSFAKVVVGKKAVDVTLTLPNAEETYGEAFAGHDMLLEASQKVDGKVVIGKYDVKATLEYKLGDKEIKAGETILDAGTYKFKPENVKVVFADGNHVAGKIIIKDADLVVNKKKVTVTLAPDFKVTKKYGQLGVAENILNKNLLIDGVKVEDLIKDEKLTEDAIAGIYSYADEIGTHDLTLASIESNNYEMVNEAVTYANMITVNKATVNVTIDDVMVDQKTNTTLVSVSPTINGKRGNIIDISLQGTDFTAEQISAEVSKYLTDTQGYVDTSYNVTISDVPKQTVKKYQNTMMFIVLAVVGVCLLAGIAMLIASIVNMKKMPKKFNQDFNFSREPGAKDLNTLMKGADKRRDNEYKSATKQISKAAKKGDYYNVEDALFPEMDIFADLDEEGGDAPAGEDTPDQE